MRQKKVNYICINAVHGDLMKFIYETTQLVLTGGEHILHSGVIDYISV